MYCVEYHDGKITYFDSYEEAKEDIKEQNCKGYRVYSRNGKLIEEG